MARNRSQRTKTSLVAPEPIPDKAPNREQVRPTGGAVRQLFADADHPGNFLTPRRIKAIFEQAEDGDPSAQCDLFEDVVERDAHLRSLLESRIQAVAGKQWIVLPGGTAPADRMVAEKLHDALRAVPNFLELLFHQLKAVWHGWSASETRWQLVGEVWAPTWFLNVPHRRFLFDRDDTIRLRTETEPHKGEVLQPGAWMVSRRPGRQTVRLGLLRSAVYFSYFKLLAMRDWAVFCERFGLPYVVGKYRDTTSQEGRKVLRQTIAAIGREGGALLEQDAEIEFLAHTVGGKSTDVQGALASFCDAQNSKLINGGTLASDTGNAGSYAQSRVHENRGFDLLLGDAEFLATRFELDIGVPFVRYNGFNAKPPRLKIHVVRDVDPLTRVQVIERLHAMGLPIDEEQLRQEFQLKTPANGGGLKAPTKPAPTDSPADV